MLTFKIVIARNASNTSASNILDDVDRDPLEYAGGEFDADEPAEIVQAVRISKARVSVRTGVVLFFFSFFIQTVLHLLR